MMMMNMPITSARGRFLCASFISLPIKPKAIQPSYPQKALRMASIIALMKAGKVKPPSGKSTDLVCKVCMLPVWLIKAAHITSMIEIDISAVKRKLRLPPFFVPFTFTTVCMMMSRQECVPKFQALIMRVAAILQMKFLLSHKTCSLFFQFF